MTISHAEYAARRNALLAQLPDSTLVVITTADEMYRSNDCDHHFRAHSDFYYLTGFKEPEAALVLKKKGDETTEILFCRAKNKEQEIWHGRRMGPESSRSVLGIEQASVISELDDTVGGLLADTDHLAYSFARRNDLSKQIDGWYKKVGTKRKAGAVPPHTEIDAAPLIHEMRVIKTAAEIELMRKAAHISADAHVRAMKAVKPGMMEFELEAEINHEFASNGARHPAYNSIVGSGVNACILHYVDNDDIINDGELVLIDAGCEYNMYAADITRTFPANGRFSVEQRAIYDIVLKAEREAVAAVEPGKPYSICHEIALRVITEGLVELGLLKGDVDELIKSEAYKEYYMHGTGHYLGIDTHDVGLYKHRDSKESVLFKPGMVLTVEPGIYISPDNTEVDEKWRGIGVRIEDDILVTENGHENLTAGVPKCADEIEALMANE